MTDSTSTGSGRGGTRVRYGIPYDGRPLPPGSVEERYERPDWSDEAE